MPTIARIPVRPVRIIRVRFAAGSRYAWPDIRGLNGVVIREGGEQGVENSADRLILKSELLRGEKG